MNGSTAENGLRLRSSIAGRDRWEAEAIRGWPAVIPSIQTSLVADSAVRSVTISPVTGSILITYDRRTTSQQIGALIRKILASCMPARSDSLAGSDQGREAPGIHTEPDRGAEQPPPIPIKASVIVGGSLLGAALLLGASALAALALAGAGAFAASVIDRGFRQQQELRPARVTSVGPHDRRHPLQALVEYARPYRRQVWFATAFSVLKKVFDIAPPVIIGLAINLLANNGSSFLAALGVATIPGQLLLIGAFTGLIFALESVFEYAQQTAWRQLAQNIQRDLRVDGYAKVQEISLSCLDNESIGEIAVPLTEQINQIETFLNGGINAFLQLASNAVIMVGIFAFLAPNLAWIVALPVPLLLWRTFRFQRTIAPLHADSEGKAGVLNKQMINNILGMSTIRSFGTEDYESERIRRQSQDYVESNQRAIFEYASFLPTFRIPVLIAFTSLIFLGGLSVANGVLPISNYTVVLYLVSRFLFPFAELGTIVDNYQRTMAAVDRVFVIFQLPVGPLGGDQSLPLALVKGDIRFNRVSFAYSNGFAVLDNFDLHVPAGQTVALVGVTGVGKSTIIKILLRFYEFEGGQVLLDGHDIRSLRLRDLRSAISLVSQDLFLLDASVRDNIVYGSFDASLDEIADAARVAGAHAFIEALPQGYDTMIGERGNRLSTGQRQRLCVARAVVKLRRAPILVLDEATSSVDSNTEAALQASLAKVAKGRTTIIIAHRLSTVRGADQIYVLGQRGAVIEHGSHEELLRNEGFYAKLWRVQSDAAALALEVRPPREHTIEAT
jgi:ATP-binding cassette subfamily B protein